MRAGSFFQGFLGACLACVVAACITVGTLTIVDVGKQQIIACKSVNTLRMVLVGIVERGAKATPTLSYYQQHPNELARVQLQIRQEEQALAPVPC